MFDPIHPIGPMPTPGGYDPQALEQSIARIASFPVRVRASLKGVDPAALEGTYRPGGWTARQIIHHLADSHLNSFCRFKLALTELNPRIKPYDENAWALLGDTGIQQLEATLLILEGLHARWAALLASLAAEQWLRTFHHPDQGRDLALHHLAHVYAWHGDHHLAQACLAMGVPVPAKL